MALKVIALLAVSIAFMIIHSNCTPVRLYQSKWSRHVKSYNLAFSNSSEEDQYYKTYEKNVNYIQDWNRNPSNTFKLAENKFTHLSNEYIRSKILLPKKFHDRKVGAGFSPMVGAAVSSTTSKPLTTTTRTTTTTTTTKPTTTTTKITTTTTTTKSTTTTTTTKPTTTTKTTTTTTTTTTKPTTTTKTTTTTTTITTKPTTTTTTTKPTTTTTKSAIISATTTTSTKPTTTTTVITTTTTKLTTTTSSIKSVNWTYLFPAVKDQGWCGSCYAFAAAGAVEASYALKYNKTVSLSEEQIIDCTYLIYNYGCSGGWSDSSLFWVWYNNPLYSTADYPYLSSRTQTSKPAGTCHSVSSPTMTRVSLSDYGQAGSNSESSVADFVRNYGPVTAYIDASLSSFHYYSSGIYNDASCTKTIDHAVLIVGYGTDANGNDYWIIRNSWGTSWGMKGYMLMARNKNGLCGIVTANYYAVVD